MKFGQMVKELLSGKSMKRVDWPDDYCIRIREDGNTVDELGFSYTFSKSDYEDDWQVYKPMTKKIGAGTLLYYAGLDGEKKYCRVIIDGDRYDIIDTSNWSVSIKNISKDDLEMAMYEFGLKKENVTGKEDK